MQNHKVAIITGASRGIGKAIAQKLASQGIKIALVARNHEELELLACEIQQKGGEAITLPTNILDENAVCLAVGKVWEKWGAIDVLINNAGVGKFKPVLETSIEDWETVMDTNAKGTFLFTKHCLAYMKEQKRGHIISIASDVARRNFANGGVYCASKYAQDALMQVVRQEVHAFDVKVSTIYPGLTETYFNEQIPQEKPNLNRLQPEDIADAVSYILHAPAHIVIDELYLHPFAQKHWQNS